MTTHQRVFDYLMAHGPSTCRQMAEALQVPYDRIQRLMERDRGDYVTVTGRGPTGPHGGLRPNIYAAIPGKRPAGERRGRPRGESEAAIEAKFAALERRA